MLAPADRRDGNGPYRNVRRYITFKSMASLKYHPNIRLLSYIIITARKHPPTANHRSDRNAAATP
jgi:hypothetical protein